MTNIELQTLSAVKNAAIKYASQKDGIDWEQRRYEIAKDVLAGRLSFSPPTDIDRFVEYCVIYADKLIECLRK